MDRKIGGLTLRELTGIALLVLLLLAGLLSCWYMTREHSRTARELEDCAWLALSGQWQQARKDADTARTRWEKSWQLQAAFSDHRPMEQINSLFSELEIYGAAGERTDFARSCAALSRQLEDLANSHRLSWWNIL